MEISATAKYLRISPKKVKIFAGKVKSLPAQEAILRLTGTTSKAGRLLSQVIKSALSNAINNLKLKEDNLIIKKIEVSKGVSFKRWQPVSRGAAHSIKKRTTHIKVVLEEIKLPK